MKRAPALSTVLVVFFVVGVPIALINRLGDGMLPLRAVDVPLVIGLVAWMLISHSILDRDDDVDSRRLSPGSPRFRAHALVEQSLLGVGFTGRASTAAESALPVHRLTPAAGDIDPALLPPRPDPVLDLRPEADRAADAPPAGAATRAPIGHRPAPRAEPSPDLSEILATEEYVCCRGDTFWSVAEGTLGDGRRWTAIQALNAGRMVEPGRILEPEDELRIGWSILIPLRPAEPLDGEIDDALP